MSVSGWRLLRAVPSSGRGYTRWEPRLGNLILSWCLSYKFLSWIWLVIGPYKVIIQVFGSFHGRPTFTPLPDGTFHCQTNTRQKDFLKSKSTIWTDGKLFTNHESSSPQEKNEATYACRCTCYPNLFAKAHLNTLIKRVPWVFLQLVLFHLLTVPIPLSGIMFFVFSVTFDLLFRHTEPGDGFYFVFVPP